MRLARALVFLIPIWLFATAANPPASPTTSPSPTAAPSASPSPSPTPTPVPVNAFLSLDVTAGDGNTVINVTGGQFLPNEAMSLYWDSANKVAGSATADANGNVTTRVKPFAGDAPGVHKLCASVQPMPCANFALQGPAASPSPSPSPTESPSPSPSPIATVTETPSSSPVAATLNGFDVISKPPFVFLPIAGAVAIGLAFAFWAFSAFRRPRPLAMPSAAIVHRAMRPDYSAGFGTPPPSAPAPAEPSAWPADTPPVRHPAEPPEQSSELAQAEWGPPVEWGTGSSDWGFPEPPPQPDDLPEPPQPGD